MSVNTFKYTDQVTITTPEGTNPVEGVAIDAESDSFDSLAIQSEVIAAGTSGTNFTLPTDPVLIHVDLTGNAILHLSGSAGVIELPLGTTKTADDAETSDPPLISVTLALNSGTASTKHPTNLKVINEAGDSIRATYKFGA